jgi:hypothetical protein
MSSISGKLNFFPVFCNLEVDFQFAFPVYRLIAGMDFITENIKIRTAGAKNI